MSGIPTILESFLETRVTKQFKEDTNMTAREKYYFDKYNLIKDVDSKTCDGTGCCSTCMYRKVEQSFENDYCVLSLKEDKDRRVQ